MLDAFSFSTRASGCAVGAGCGSGRAVAIVDSECVNRFWAKSLGLNPEDILLLLMLAKEEHTATSLSIATGRLRQQTHCSLLRFESVHLVGDLISARLTVNDGDSTARSEARTNRGTKGAKSRS